MRLHLVVLCACAMSAPGSAEDAPPGGAPALTEMLKPSHMFAFSVFEKLIRMRQGRNMIMSAPAMLNSLTMLYEGATGETEKLLQEVVKFPVDRPGYRAALKSCQEALQKNLGPLNVYSSGSRIFAADTLQITDTYKNILSANYPQSRIEQLDYKKADEAVRAINAWVSVATNGSIPSVVDEGNIDSNTELMIVNVEYFKGLWKFPFKAQATQDMPFHLSSRRQIAVPTMYVSGNFQVRHLPHLTMLKLPYEDSKLSFVIVMPDADSSLDYMETYLARANEEFKHPEAAAKKCEVFLPKFTIEETLDMSSILKESGLEPLFSKDMSLTTMVGDRLLSVSDILQKARVQVDELGSTAAAAQVVTVGWRMARRVPKVVINRPFLFMIHEEAADNPLFIGKYYRPS